jgi:anti-sigma factor RsiW
MTTNAECRRVRELMDSYISGELTVESNHEVLRHLERCDACRSELARREQTRALLIGSFGDAPDAAGLEARIAGAIDREQPMWKRVMRYGGIAAAIAIVIGAALWFSRPVDAAAYVDSVDNHIACALTLPPNVAYDWKRVEQSLAAPYNDIINAAPHKSGDYDLIDAHMCPYNGRDYAHLVYQSGAHRVSVFAETAARGRLPASHEPERKGFVSTGASTGGHQVFVVAEGATPLPSSVLNDLMSSTLTFVKRIEDR